MVLGGVIATGVLLITSATAPSHWFALSAIILFVLGLILLSVASCLFLAANKRRHGFSAILLAIAFAGCSCLPWYGKHVGEPGDGYHRHALWQIVHVH